MKVWGMEGCAKQVMVMDSGFQSRSAVRMKRWWTILNTLRCGYELEINRHKEWESA